MARVILLLAAGIAALGLAFGAAAAGPANEDYAAAAFDILPPGENGSVAFDVHTDDQAKLYDGLTPLGGSVTDADIKRFYKPDTFGPGTATPVKAEDVGRPGVQVVRDSFGVAHVDGKTRADVMYADGWVTAEDRGLLMELLRTSGRLAAIDAPGYDAFAVALTGRKFVPSAQTEGALAKQYDLLRKAGPKGLLVIADVDAFLAGINGYYKAKGLPVDVWTRNDVISVGALIGGVFGKGGGDEVRRSEFLAALRGKLGAAKGKAVWNDLSELDDPEAPVAVPGTFPVAGIHPAKAPGSVVLDDGSFQAWTAPAAPAIHAPATMSNALLVAAPRSVTSHPLFVAGAQLGYFFPEVVLEEDLHGGGIDVRGALVPGIPYVVLGRGKDYAWSATSSNSDIVDDYVETLCGDDTHYTFKGTCTAMTTFEAGVLKGAPGKPDTPVSFRQTVHGPVIGYATVNGVRVAVSQTRATRGREGLSLIAFQDLNGNVPTDAKSFAHVMNGMELTFNWHYADDRDIAVFSSGRVPVRPAGVDPGLPTAGTGAYEWKGFLTEAQHAQAIDPPAGAIVNWNNKPAKGYGASDDNWAFGSVQRVQLLAAGIAARPKHTLASVVSAMNRAATQDLPAIQVLPVVEAVLKTGPAPNARAQQLVGLMEAWRAKGASRLDRNGDGKVDDPGVAILDVAWQKLADAVMSPVLGPLTERLAELNQRSQDPSGSNGSSYFNGWYGYVDKDLRRLLGRPVQGAFSTRYCGGGVLAACRTALWAAIDAAGTELAAAQGPDPKAWRADAKAERIHFSPGILPATMRWTNRPTFQQVITFAGHRPR